MSDAPRTPEDMDKALFASLIMMLSSSAMQQLGKIADPMTNKSETNLPGAQVTIDMLQMIQKRTKGNLDDEEDRMLADVLSSLQMNYVETARSAAAEPGADITGKDSAADNAAEPETGDADPNQPKDEPKEPKYRKSYG